MTCSRPSTRRASSTRPSPYRSAPLRPSATGTWSHQSSHCCNERGDKYCSAHAAPWANSVGKVGSAAVCGVVAHAGMPSNTSWCRSNRTQIPRSPSRSRASTTRSRYTWSTTPGSGIERVGTDPQANPVDAVTPELVKVGLVEDRPADLDVGGRRLLHHVRAVDEHHTPEPVDQVTTAELQRADQVGRDRGHRVRRSVGELDRHGRRHTRRHHERRGDHRCHVHRPPCTPGTPPLQHRPSPRPHD